MPVNPQLEASPQEVKYDVGHLVGHKELDWLGEGLIVRFSDPRTAVVDFGPEGKRLTPLDSLVPIWQPTRAKHKPRPRRQPGPAASDSGRVPFQISEQGTARARPTKKVVKKKDAPFRDGVRLSRRRTQNLRNRQAPSLGSSASSLTPWPVEESLGLGHHRTRLRKPTVNPAAGARNRHTAPRAEKAGDIQTRTAPSPPEKTEEEHSEEHKQHLWMFTAVAQARARLQTARQALRKIDDDEDLALALAARDVELAEDALKVVELDVGLAEPVEAVAGTESHIEAAHASARNLIKRHSKKHRRRQMKSEHKNQIEERWSDEEEDVTPGHTRTLSELVYHVLLSQNIDLLDGFKTFDTNHDGVLDGDELVQGFQVLTDLEIPVQLAIQLIQELGGGSGPGATVSYLSFVRYFEKLAGDQAQRRHEHKFGTLCMHFAGKGAGGGKDAPMEDGRLSAHACGHAWPHWDGLSTEAQDACVAMGYWPSSQAAPYPPKDSAIAAFVKQHRYLRQGHESESEESELDKEEEQARAAEEEASLSKQRWNKARRKINAASKTRWHRPKQKRDLDWKSGWVMPTIKVDDDEQELLTFDDWMLLTGQNNTAEPTTRGKRGKRNESGDDLLTPRSRENKLKATLRSLGLSDRLTSWELQRLEQELLDHTYEHPADLDRESTDSGPKSRSTMGAAGNTSGYRTTISRERARPAGQLRVALLAARQIPTTKGTVLHAYAVARTGRHRFESPVDRTSDGPDGRFEWTTNFVPVPVAPATMRTIEFSVWNSEVTGDDVLMGSVTAVLEDIMPVQQLSAGREAATVVQWMRLKPPPGQLSTSGRGAGELQMRLSFIPRPMDDLDHQLNIELAAAERARASLIAAAKAAEENRSMSALVQRMLEAETLDHAGASLPDVCIIHRRGRGFGEAARYSQAAVSAQRMGKLLRRGENTDEAQTQKRLAEQAALQAAGVQQAKRAAVALANLEDTKQRAQVAQVDTSTDGFRLATSSFGSTTELLLQSDKRLVQHAGGLANVAIEMWSQLPPGERKRWETRAYGLLSFGSPSKKPGLGSPGGSPGGSPRATTRKSPEPDPASPGGGTGRLYGVGTGGTAGLPHGLGGERWWMRESSKANRRARDRRGLELFWNQVDDDGSGTLERGELDILMIKMGMVLNRKQKREAMAAMDDDGSGCISFAEFEAWWKARRPGATGAEVNSTMLERSLADRRPVSLPEIYRG